MANRNNKKYRSRNKNQRRRRRKQAKRVFRVSWKAVAIAAGIFAAFGLTIFILNKLFFAKPSGQSDIATTPTADPGYFLTDTPEIVYKSYRYELSDEEITKLKDLGISEETIQNTNPDEFLLDLYSREVYINHVYMNRYESLNSDTEEPSDEERESILDEMKDLYRQQKYNDVVRVFNSYLMEYTFEDYRDADITSLYYDAQQMIPPANEDGTASAPLTREQVGNIMDQRYSAWAVVYDAFSINAELIKDHTVDGKSCIILSPLKEVKQEHVYDYRLREIELTGPSADTDLIYEYSFKDEFDRTGKVYVQSAGIKKSLVGVYYDQPGCSMIEFW